PDASGAFGPGPGYPGTASSRSLYPALFSISCAAHGAQLTLFSSIQRRRKMTVLVGYVTNPAGHAALDAAIAQAKKDGKELVVVNASRSTQRNDSYRLGDGELRSVKDYLRRSDVEFRVLTLGSEYDPAEQILDTATEV